MNDARRGLGIRPGKIPELRINVSDNFHQNAEAGPSCSPREPSPTNNGKSPTFRDFSLPLPSARRGSSSPTTPRSPSLGVGELQARVRRATLRPKESQPTRLDPPKGLYESQKLLAHVLDRLEGRLRPPDLLERAAAQAKSDVRSSKEKRKSGTGVRQLGQAVVGVAQSGLQVGQAGVGAMRGISSTDVIDNDDHRTETSEHWDIEGTYGLLEHLRDLLLLADRQGLDLLGGNKTEIRHRGKNSQGRSSPLASPNETRGNPFQSQQDLSRAQNIAMADLRSPRRRIMAILRSLISADAHYPVVSFGPLCPPKALQAASLDIATYLHHSSGMAGKCDLVEVMVNALYTFEGGMLERLYLWLEGRVGDMLAILASQSDNSTGGVLSDRMISSSKSDATLRLSSLIVRLLAAICDTINLDDAPISTIYRVHRLVVLLLSAKPDASLDLLEIAAFAPESSRRIAVCILTTYFPQVMGHNIIARRPPDLSYAARLVKWETGQTKSKEEDDAENHHYIHWRVSSRDRTRSIRPLPTCSTCEGDIRGYCIKCTLCYDVQHLDCYRSAEGTFRYEVDDTDKPGGQLRTIVAKFSRQLGTLEEKLVSGTSKSTHPTSTQQLVGDHDLHRVHLFTSTPCQACRNPVWSSPSSVYACFGGCQAFYHAECLSKLSNSEHSRCQSRQVWSSPHFTITKDALYHSFADSEAKSLCMSAEDLSNQTYDEVAILYGTLWIRYQTLKAGLAAGTLAINSDTHESPNSDPLGVRATLRVYEDYLDSRTSPSSGALSDFVHVYGFDDPLAQGYLFSDTYLAYIIALLKSPDTPDGGSNSTYSALPISAVLSTLASDLSITSDVVAGALIQQLEIMGYIRTTSEERKGKLSSKWVHFDLPLLIESSPAVDILIEFIAGSLDSLDLTMVEQALILLTNRAWPSLLCIPHALERFGSVVIRWVISEENTLHRIVREYASKHKPLPGLRVVQGATSSRTSGPVQLYQEARNSLLRRYIQPWLEALHSQDPLMYAEIIYEECKAQSVTHIDIRVDREDMGGAEIANLALDRLVSVVDAGIAFSCLMELLMSWLEDLGSLASQDNAYKSLPRLISRLQSPAPGSTNPADIFVLALETASHSPEGTIVACRWIRILACSGVEVPWRTIRNLTGLERETASRMIGPRMDIAIAVQTDVAVIDAGDFAALCGDLLVVYVEGLEACGSHPPTETSAIIDAQYLDLILRLILRAYGVDDDQVSLAAFNSQKAKAQHNGSSAKHRRPVIPAFRGIPLDENVILGIIKLIHYGAYHTPVLLDFLWLVFTQASAVSNSEETIYAMAQSLCEILWPLTNEGTNQHRKLRLLLKIITLNPAPLESIIKADISHSNLKRSVTIERLLKFVLDLGDDSMTAEVHNWRGAVSELTVIFLISITGSNKEDPALMAIRHSLTPTHLESTSKCFEAYLIAGSDESRLRLLVCLKRFRLHFPSWPIISWSVLDDLLTETAVAINQVAPGKSSQNVFALLDSQSLRYQLIALGLDMLAFGIPIPYTQGQRFQQHVAALCAIPWPEPNEGLMSTVLPALRDVLDSAKQVKVSATQSTEIGNKKKVALVGSLFVPAVIEFAGVLADKPVLAQRYILDILLIVFYKQNVISVLHPAMNALQNVAIFIEKSDCADNRILALAVVQAALDKMRREDLARIMPAVFLALSATVSKEVKDGGSISVIDNCCVLLRHMIKMFGKAGLLLNVIRLDGADSTAVLTGSVTAEILLRLYPPGIDAPDAVTLSSLLLLLLDEIPDGLKRGRLAMEQVLSGLLRFVPIVAPFMLSPHVDAYGSFLGKLGKHVAEWTNADYDPDQTLRATASVLLLASPDPSTPILSQVATFLHLCLSRFDVTNTSLEAVLKGSANLGSRIQAENIPQVVVLEFAISAIQGMEVSPVTLSTLLQYLITQQSSSSPLVSNHGPNPKLMPDHARDLVIASKSCLDVLLRRHSCFSSAYKQDAHLTLEILDRASTITLIAENYISGNLGQAISYIISTTSHQQLNIFTSLLLSSHKPTISYTARSAIIKLYPVLARIITGALRQIADLLVNPSADAAGQGTELLSAISVATRLASLVAEKARGEKRGKGTEEIMETFWLGIGSEWIRIVSLSVDSICVNTSLRTTTHSTFLDTVNFLGHFHSAQIGRLANGVEMLTEHAERFGTGGGKLSKAIATVNAEKLYCVEVVNDTERQKLLEAVKGDIIATERLRALKGIPA